MRTPPSALRFGFQPKEPLGVILGVVDAPHENTVLVKLNANGKRFVAGAIADGFITNDSEGEDYDND